MSAVAKIPNQALAVSEREMIDTLKNSLYPGASDASVAMVLGYCKVSGLDPMKKPVHIVPIWSKAAGAMVDTIMPGIALYRIDAARTGEYVGKSEPEFGPEQKLNLGGVETRFPAWCKITVQRMVAGQVCEFTAKEYWLENYATAKKDSDAPNSMWRKRPYGQIAKCAEAQALRMAFPEQTGGTNTDDEMAGKTFADEPVRLTSESSPIEHAAPAPRPVDHVTRFKAWCDKSTRPEHCIETRKKFVAVASAADAAGTPIPEDVQAQIFEMIETRQDELAAAFAPIAEEEHVPA